MQVESQSAEQIVTLLHAAADRVGYEANTRPMNRLAEAGAIFLRDSHLRDEDGTPVVLSPEQAIGYGIMLGWLARIAADQEPDI